MKKLLILLSLFAFTLSCQVDDQQSIKTNVDQNSHSLHKREASISEVKVISRNPLKIESENFTVLDAYFVNEKKHGQIIAANTDITQIMSKEKEVVPGFHLASYGDHDCMVYGTWTYDYDAGTVTFTSASIATQILMNVCTEQGTRWA
ncbi:hypothetical protein [Flavobacterium sp.]|uniref:hypothetical protein n=1 Tax=Flavobacterium sp. TaxID=239 RepID=UPI004033B9B3